MKFSLENDTSTISVESFGGAITEFFCKGESKINPLNFAFSSQQMPGNNKTGAPYRGHFLCAGRWGEPSEGEIKNNVPNHGEAANIDWQVEKNNNQLRMQTTALKEGLHIERIIEQDKHLPVFTVSETFSNINVLGRLYNVVQHPTLAAPFLNAGTIINCNATLGFNQEQYVQAEQKRCCFPEVEIPGGNVFNLKNPQEKYNSVFSFIVEASNTIGWLTAYSPVHRLLFGYIWKRSHYPWIHLWQHWNEDTISYRGMEFGTAGIHQPFHEILQTANQLFGEKTFAYIDAGESVCKKYCSFMYKTEDDFTETDNVTIAENCIIITSKEGKNTRIETSINLTNELSA